MLLQICQGGRVPERFYLSAEGIELDHMSTKDIFQGEKLRLEYRVEQPNCVLRSVVISDENSQVSWKVFHLSQVFQTHSSVRFIVEELFLQ